MASALINEVASAQSFFSLRASDDPSYGQMAKNFANALIQQVNSCLTMTLPDATLVIHALKESPYADADLKRITAAIDAKVLIVKSSKAAPVKDQIRRPAGYKHEVLDKPKVEKNGIKRDADSLGVPLMPKESKDGNPAAVQYLGAVIYTVQDQCKFRRLKTKGDKYSKTFFRSWRHKKGTSSRTKKEAWDACIAAIQAHEK